jgi:hypothetical protein
MNQLPPTTTTKKEKVRKIKKQILLSTSARPAQYYGNITAEEPMNRETPRRKLEEASPQSASSQ